jgi:hypothetical protein
VAWFDQPVLGDDYEELFGKFIPDRAFARWEKTEQEMRENLEDVFDQASELIFTNVCCLYCLTYVRSDHRHLPIP